MIISVIIGFFIGGTVLFFAIAACAMSKKADERIEKFSPYSEGVRQWIVPVPPQIVKTGRAGENSR